MALPEGVVVLRMAWVIFATQNRKSPERFALGAFHFPASCNYSSSSSTSSLWCMSIQCLAFSSLPSLAISSVTS